jgi:hypothetical protein
MNCLTAANFRSVFATPRWCRFGMSRAAWRLPGYVNHQGHRPRCTTPKVNIPFWNTGAILGMVYGVVVYGACLPALSRKLRDMEPNDGPRQVLFGSLWSPSHVSTRKTQHGSLSCVFVEGYCPRNGLQIFSTWLVHGVGPEPHVDWDIRGAWMYQCLVWEFLRIGHV